MGIQTSACNLCGGQRYFLIYQKKQPVVSQEAQSGYTISDHRLVKPNKMVQCASCGLVYAIHPERQLDRIRADYETMEDPEYLREEKGRRVQAGIILSRIERYKKGGRLLDIGCGPGFFLDEAKRRGWQTQGVDLSRWSARYAQEHFQIPVFQGMLAQAGFEPKSFDMIVLNDVLEHLEDPKTLLKQVRRILKNDGIIYVSTPDINSGLSRLLKAKWWGINKYHLVYFSRKTLKAMMHEVGFKPLAYSAYPRVFSLAYWAKRLEDYPPIFFWLFWPATKIGWLGRRQLKVDFHDQISVIGKKIRQLQTLAEDEEEVSPVVSVKKKVIVVLPAYNAERTLERTVTDIPKGLVDEILLVDDASKDGTVAAAQKLGLIIYRHEKNLGYGGNQKTCYEKALERDADIVVMCHPDYQYDPRIIPHLVDPIAKGQADAVFGSRMIKGGALEGGMPPWKHNANILLTAFENVMLGTYLTEYHSGFRAYSARLLRTVNFKSNSDGFIFDTEIITQAIANRFKIEEVPIRTRYFEEASSIRLIPSILYGLGIMRVMVSYWLHAKGLWHFRQFDPAAQE